MKMLFVIAALRNGGAERVLSVAANEFSKKNEVHILLLENENLGFYEFNKSVIFHNLNAKNGKIGKILALRNAFKSINPGVIISFIDWTNVLCVVANFGLNYKLIATEHHSHDYLKSPKFRVIRDLAYRRVSALSVLNRADLEYYKFVKNRVILHNPLSSKPNENPKKQNLILSVGRLEFVKGYDIFFKALSKIKTLLNGYEIAIAGDGRERENLKKLADDLGLDIKFLGHQTDLATLYERAKIFVLSSRSEGFANVLIEAANFGCARICSDTAGARELVINGKDALVFECENDDELSMHLSTLLNDEKLTQTLGLNAKKSVADFSVDKIFLKWQELVNSVVKGI